MLPMVRDSCKFYLCSPTRSTALSKFLELAAIRENSFLFHGSRLNGQGMTSKDLEFWGDLDQTNKNSIIP